jgi:hypothetical protein
MEKTARTSALTAAGLPVRAPVACAEQFGVPFEADPRGRADPRPGHDPVAEQGRMLVVDLVPHHHPDQLRLVGGRRRGGPMRDRGLLHPTQVGHVVDVAQFVDVGGFDRDQQFVRLRGVAHGY